MGINPLLREPWAITAEGMAVAVAIASRDDVFADARQQALAARDGRPLANTRAVTVRDGVAEIPLQGTMFRHADLLSAISGGVSYATLRKDLQTALEDPSVTAIMFNVDSPGGEVNGCAELAEAIYAARAVKPIGAYVGGQGCSAAYWLASAADKIYCASTAQLGSIGICATFTDDSKAQEAAGKKTVQIVSTQSPDKNVDPTTDAGRVLTQSRLDAVAQVFIGDVARHRGVTDAKVATKFGRGGVLIGAEAVQAGMADEVTNYESALADMAKRGAAAKQRETLMGQEQEQLAAFAAFEREVFSALGVKDRAGALGSIVALVATKADAERAVKDLAEFRKSTLDAECKRMLDDASTAGRLPPAKRGDIEAMYSKYGLDAVKATLSMLPVVAQTAAEAPRAPVVLQPVAGGAGAEFSAQELEIAKAIVGPNPQALQDHLTKLREYKASRAAAKKAG